MENIVESILIFYKWIFIGLGLVIFGPWLILLTISLSPIILLIILIVRLFK